jgi:hypothetical protein
MRDNHKGMPEIVDAFEKAGLYFGIVEIQISSESKQFQFGISQNGYRALRKILQLRPFGWLESNRGISSQDRMGESQVARSSEPMSELSKIEKASR